ncbi:MAG: hypothetical protein QUS11_10250 [Candidatus Fermentibacter sp.]|nr:hypothetical protein [Candidatus Fermentibacter sp.]
MQPVTATIPAIPRDPNEFSELAGRMSATPRGAAALEWSSLLPGVRGPL